MHPGEALRRRDSEQAENLSVRAARYGLRFEGLDEPMPTEDEIREALRRPGGEARAFGGGNAGHVYVPHTR